MWKTKEVIMLTLFVGIAAFMVGIVVNDVVCYIMQTFV